MSNKAKILVTALLVGFIVLVVIAKNAKPKEAILGVNYPNQGEKHIARGQKGEAYNSSPPSSGSHYSDPGTPALWGVYTQEVPAEVFLHNEEHGGVIVTYNPKLLPADQLKKLQALFTPPYSNKDFMPSKAIVTPRAAATKAIEMASWRYTLSLDKYDEPTLIKFYNQRLGKSPEPFGGPSNTPINQAAGR